MFRNGNTGDELTAAEEIENINKQELVRLLID